MRRFVLLMILLSIVSIDTNIYAQFGKNLVQYQEFKWKYIESDHFTIYYNEGSKYLAEFAAIEAEISLLSVQKTLNYDITKRIPMVVYDTHNEFQQTNVVSSFMPEGVGGVTELFKNRVVVPFQGDYSQFRHVIHHELVHAVMNDMFFGGSIQSVIYGNFMFPIWVAEGMAEYESQSGMNIENDMYMRDLTISELLPNIKSLDNYLAYRGGQTLFWYISDKFGKDKVTDLIQRIRIYKNVERAFVSTFNMKLDEFSDMWVKDIKKMYWPDLKIFEDPTDFSTKITNRKEIGNFYNSSPAISPDGEKMAYISDRDGLFNIYIQYLHKKEEPEKLVGSLRQMDFEDLNFLTPGISWSPDGKKLVVSAKSGGEDAIFIVDSKTGDYDKLKFGIKSISSVQWSPDGKKLAFIASIREQSDIFIYDIQTAKLENITNDVFSDVYLIWNSKSDKLFFISDRDDVLDKNISSKDFKIWKHNYEASDLYSIDLNTKSIKRLTNDPNNKKTSLAISSDDGKLLFTSDKNGIINLYELELNSNQVKTLTNSISGITQLSLAKDNSKLLFTAQNDAGYDIFMLKNPFELKDKKDIPLTTFKSKQTGSETVVQETLPEKTSDSKIEGFGNFEIDIAQQQLVQANKDIKPKAQTENYDQKYERYVNMSFAEKDYKVTFSQDLLMANPGYSTFYGVQGAAQMLFSDMLGDHRIGGSLYIVNDIVNSHIYATYEYLPKIIDYSFSLYNRSVYTQLNGGSGAYSYYRFRNYGAVIGSSYAFDLFTRVELNLTLAGGSRVSLEGDLGADALTDISRFLIMPELRFVLDNALGGIYAPSMGTRMYVSLMGSPKFASSSSVGFFTAMTDIRQYIPIWDLTGFALRGVAGVSLGQNKQTFFVAGTDNWINYTLRDRLPLNEPQDFMFMQNFLTPVRGWTVGEIKGSKFFVANAELRFPFLTAVMLGPLPLFFQGMMGCVFVDAAGLWDEKFIISQKKSDGKLYPNNLLVSSGVGARANVFGLPLKLDVAWKNLYHGWSEPVYLISLGYDF